MGSSVREGIPRNQKVSEDTRACRKAQPDGASEKLPKNENAPWPIGHGAPSGQPSPRTAYAYECSLSAFACKRYQSNLAGYLSNAVIRAACHWLRRELISISGETFARLHHLICW